jgi:hypothetical protein
MSIMINKNSFIPTAYHLKLFGILINVKIIWVATVDLQLLIENCSVCTYRKFEPENRAQLKTQETTFPRIFEASLIQVLTCN